MKKENVHAFVVSVQTYIKSKKLWDQMINLRCPYSTETEFKQVLQWACIDSPLQYEIHVIAITTSEVLT